MKKYDVTALGELLIDFTYTGTSEQGNSVLEANPGGAPCNVLAMLNQCHRSTNFIGKVGKDQFGNLLRDTLEDLKIGTDGLCFDNEVKTTLAFVKTFANGDRDFAFYRNPGADMMLTPEEVQQEQIENSRIFHFGTLSMTHEGVCLATEKAVNAAKSGKTLISFDPNLRIPLWKDLQTAKEKMRYGLSKCDVCKISEEVEQASCNLVRTIETTGAGDTFCGSILHHLLDREIESLTEEDLRQMLVFANAAAYLVTTKKGAIRSMPNLSEVEKLIEENR